MITNLLTRFATEDGPAVHVAPADVFQIGNITITNSILYGWICMAFMIVVLVTVARMVTVRPRGGLIQVIEMGVEFVTKLVEGVFDDKSKGAKYVPFFVTLFFFLLFNNILGLLPGVGETFTSGGHPLLRPFTADLNGTLAAGIVTMGFVYFSSIRESGGVTPYMRHFFVGSPLNPLYLVIGLLEILTDLTRLFSLALRLFLNVTIGEIVIAVFAYLGGLLAVWLSPVAAFPFTMIEIFVGALQAYIFVVLSLMYLAIAVNHSHDHAEEHENLTEHAEAETMKLTPGEA